MCSGKCFLDSFFLSLYVLELISMNDGCSGFEASRTLKLGSGVIIQGTFFTNLLCWTEGWSISAFMYNRTTLCIVQIIWSDFELSPYFLFSLTNFLVYFQDIVEGQGNEAREEDTVEFNYVCRRSNGYFVHRYNQMLCLEVLSGYSLHIIIVFYLQLLIFSSICILATYFFVYQIMVILLCFSWYK